jgi:hypothetical protein
MQLTATLPDESLDALATRVYDLGDKPSQSAVRAAAKALTHANPALRRMADVQPGTVVEVPPLEDAALRPRQTRSEDDVATGLLRDHVAAAAGLVARRLFADLESERADAEETLKLARSPELKRLKQPGLAEALPQAVAAAEARVAAADELRSRRDVVLAQLATDLRDFTSGHPEDDATTS